MKKAISCVYTLPFNIVVDKNFPPIVRLMKINDVRVRLYPPFRSSLGNWAPLPMVKMEAVPFLGNRKFKNKFDILPIPVTFFNLGSDGPGVVANIGEVIPSGVRHIPMDSIRVDILDDAGDMNIEGELYYFLCHVRSITKQWWINQATAPMFGWTRCTFGSDFYGDQLDDIFLVSKFRTPVGMEIAVTEGIWGESATLFEKGGAINAAEQLILDAYYHLSCGDIRKMVIDAASACEMSKDINLERLWMLSNENKKYSRGKVLKGYDICDHADIDARRIFGKSFKDEFPEDFLNIGFLWDARGNVSHGKPPFYSVDNKRVMLSSERAGDLMASAVRYVDWFGSACL